MAHKKPNKKVANGLLALSSAAALAVYTAGYARTKPAANRLAYETFLESHAPTRAVRDLPAAPAATGYVEAAPAVEAPPVPARPENRRATMSAQPVTASSTPSVTTASSPAAEPAAAPVETSAASVTTATSVAPASPAASVSIVGEGQPEASAATATAAATTATSTAPAPPATPVWKDGKYSAWGTCRHGDIQATVVIEAGKIVSAEITDCRTRYSCDIIETLPPKVITRQKAKFDVVGGATESAYAYYGAIYWALDQASK